MARLTTPPSLHGVLCVFFLFNAVFLQVLTAFVCPLPHPCFCMGDEVINCANQWIQEIPKVLKTHNTNLLHLNLSNNILTSLPQDVFYGINTRSVTLDHNNIALLHSVVLGVLKFRRDSLKGQKNLYSLDLSYNRLDHFDQGTWQDAEKICSLRLRYNRFKTLHDDTFKLATTLQTLDLEGNFLDVVPTTIFKHLPSLRVINLRNNQIKDVTSDAFVGVGRALEMVDLGQNQAPLTIHKDALCPFKSASGEVLANREPWSWEVKEKNPATSHEDYGASAKYLSNHHNSMEKFSHLSIPDSHNRNSNTHFSNGNPKFIFKNDHVRNTEGKRHNSKHNLNYNSNSIYNKLNSNNKPSRNPTKNHQNNIKKAPNNNKHQYQTLNNTHSKAPSATNQHSTLTKNSTGLKVLLLDYNGIKRFSMCSIKGLKNISHVDLTGNPLFCDCSMVYLALTLQATSILTPPSNPSKRTIHPPSKQPYFRNSWTVHPSERYRSDIYEDKNIYPTKKLREKTAHRTKTNNKTDMRPPTRSDVKFGSQPREETYTSPGVSNLFRGTQCAAPFFFAGQFLSNFSINLFHKHCPKYFLLSELPEGTLSDENRLVYQKFSEKFQERKFHEKNIESDFEQKHASENNFAKKYIFRDLQNKNTSTLGRKSKILLAQTPQQYKSLGDYSHHTFAQQQKNHQQQHKQQYEQQNQLKANSKPQTAKPFKITTALNHKIPNHLAFPRSFFKKCSKNSAFNCTFEHVEYKKFFDRKLLVGVLRALNPKQGSFLFFDGLMNTPQSMMNKNKNKNALKNVNNNNEYNSNNKNNKSKQNNYDIHPNIHYAEKQKVSARHNNYYKNNNSNNNHPESNSLINVNYFSKDLRDTKLNTYQNTITDTNTNHDTRRNTNTKENTKDTNDVYKDYMYEIQKIDLCIFSKKCGHVDRVAPLKSQISLVLAFSFVGNNLLFCVTLVFIYC